MDFTTDDGTLTDPIDADAVEEVDGEVLDSEPVESEEEENVWSVNDDGEFEEAI